MAERTSQVKSAEKSKVLRMPSRRPSREEIGRRAYELYQARGGEHGHDLADWLSAEASLVAQPSGRPRRVKAGLRARSN